MKKYYGIMTFLFIFIFLSQLCSSAEKIDLNNLKYSTPKELLRTYISAYQSRRYDACAVLELDNAIEGAMKLENIPKKYRESESTKISDSLGDKYKKIEEGKFKNDPSTAYLEMSSIETLGGGKYSLFRYLYPKMEYKIIEERKEDGNINPMGAGLTGQYTHRMFLEMKYANQSNSPFDRKNKNAKVKKIVLDLFANCMTNDKKETRCFLTGVHPVDDYGKELF